MWAGLVSGEQTKIKETMQLKDTQKTTKTNVAERHQKETIQLRDTKRNNEAERQQKETMQLRETKRNYEAERHQKIPVNVGCSVSGEQTKWKK